jgi:3-oxoacyl-[acyl-carrier-protein] synthase II
MLGHMSGAAAAVEAVACLLAIHHGVVPPTANHQHPMPGCALDVVPNRARSHRVDVALSNAFGFGGNVCCVVFTRD